MIPRSALSAQFNSTSSTSRLAQESSAPRSRRLPAGTAISLLSLLQPTTHLFALLNFHRLEAVSKLAFSLLDSDSNHDIDTLWASGYEIYDRISEPYQKFLESLTATFQTPSFNEIAARGGFELYSKPRGAPENIGTELKAIHPVVRTNPVTGWKSIFPVGGHVKHINGVTEDESNRLRQWFLDLVHDGHDLQVRFRWQNPNDIGMYRPL